MKWKAYAKSHWLWLVVFGISLVFGIASRFLEMNDTYLSFGIIAQLGLAPLYCITVWISFALSERFFSQRRYVLYGLLLSLLIIASTTIAEWYSPFIDPDLATFSPTVHFIGISFIVSLCHYIRSIRTQVLRKHEYLEYKAQKTEAELKLLRQQINPHFLFNTLNSIYVHALEKKEQTPDMVMNLAEMLRYQLESNAKEEIPIEEEIDFLNHYIYFEKKRLPTHVQIAFNCQIDHPQRLLPPNLLMPVIENVFKHGIQLNKPCLAEISLNLRQGILSLETRNAIYEMVPNSTRIGLNNLQQRLSFLYSNRFSMDIQKIENQFIVQLRIEL